LTLILPVAVQISDKYQITLSNHLFICINGRV